jgi:hypothetical protein
VFRVIVNEKTSRPTHENHSEGKSGKVTNTVSSTTRNIQYRVHEHLIQASQQIKAIVHDQISSSGSMKSKFILKYRDKNSKIVQRFNTGQISQIFPTHHL